MSATQKEAIEQYISAELFIMLNAEITLRNCARTIYIHELDNRSVSEVDEISSLLIADWTKYILALMKFYPLRLCLVKPWIRTIFIHYDFHE